MKTKVITTIKICLQLLVILYLTSCATGQLTIPKEIDIPSTELSNKIPLKAGLYLSQYFRTLKAPLQIKKIVFDYISVGDTFCNSSEKIMKNIFQEVIILDPMESPSDSTTKKYDVIVAPELFILETDLLGSTRFNYWCLAQTVIKWKIASPEGKDIYISTVKSDEIKIHKGEFVECIKLSLKDNFQKAQEDIYMNSWWKKQWWKANN